MLTLAALLALLVVEPPHQGTNPACNVLTPQEVTALVGSGAKTIPVSANPNGGSCMYQNGEKMITVLVAKQTTEESAAALWTSKKRIVSGEDVKGWPSKAYEGAMGTIPIVGLSKGMTFVEVKVIDAKQKLADLAPKLRGAMKGVASRM